MDCCELFFSGPRVANHLRGQRAGLYWLGYPALHFGDHDHRLGLGDHSHEPCVLCTSTGWEMLGRTFLFALGCILLLPIPWVLRWYTQWYASQFALVERGAHANA